MHRRHCRAPELASLFDGSSAGELIPELARRGLQQLIELEVAAVLGADRHERSEERLGYRNSYRLRSLTTQLGGLKARRRTREPASSRLTASRRSFGASLWRLSQGLLAGTGFAWRSA